MEPIVYLPIELKHRDMPARLVIAAHLLGLGFSVVIGNHWSLTLPENQRAFPPGAYLFKTVNKMQGQIMALARERGHLVAATDEEVLVFTDYDGFITIFAENAANNCNLFFAQNEAHREAVERRWPVLAGRVRITGNVRADLLAPRNRVVFEVPDPAVEASKPYVLFNSNIGTINSVWTDSGRVMAMALATTAHDRETTTRNVQAIAAWEQGNYAAMMALLNWTLQSAKGLNLVVRPHPSERTANWEAALSGFPRAKVIARSDPHPWIAGAELVVHTGCTTGLEAAFMGKPAINLLPADHPLSRQIVTEVNPTFRRWEDAAQAMAAFMTGRTGPVAAHASLAAEALARHWPSFGADAAARLIAGHIAQELTARGAAPRADVALHWRGAFTEVPLQDLQRDKFSTTPDEMASGMKKAAGLAGFGGALAMSQVGEGLFLFTPA